MAKITVREIVKETMENINLDNVPVSELSISGQTWSSDDRQFFKRALEYNNTSIKKYVKKHITAEADRTTQELGEALLSRDRVMFEKMEEQTNLMRDIKTDIEQIKLQASLMSVKYEDMHTVVLRIDKRTKLPIVYLRLVITALLTGAALYLLIKYAHDHLWTSKLLSLWK